MDSSLKIWVALVLALAWQTYMIYNVSLSTPVKFFSAFVRKGDGDDDAQVEYWKALLNFVVVFALVYILFMVLEHKKDSTVPGQSCPRDTIYNPNSGQCDPA